jgi:DNA-binding beta-propeller fold protein YncE
VREFFTKPHNVRISPDGFLYCSDLRDHTVRKFTPEGKLVMTLGTVNVPSETGAEGGNYKTVKRSAGPFNGPTDVAFGPSGELYISDAYATRASTGSLRAARSFLRGARPGTSRASSACPTAP